MYRNNSYDNDFATEMKDGEFRSTYFLALLADKEEPMSIDEALRFVIRRMGPSDFAKLVGDTKQNIQKFLNAETKSKVDTLDRYLKPFKLRVKLTVEKAA